MSEYKYRITITDINRERVKDDIEQNLKDQERRNAKVRATLKTFNKFIGRAGAMLDVSISWTWFSDKVLYWTISSTADLKTETFDNVVKGLKTWGEIKIERLDGEEGVLIE